MKCIRSTLCMKPARLETRPVLLQDHEFLQMSVLGSARLPKIMRSPNFEFSLLECSELILSRALPFSERVHRIVRELLMCIPLASLTYPPYSMRLSVSYKLQLRFFDGAVHVTEALRLDCRAHFQYFCSWLHCLGSIRSAKWLLLMFSRIWMR